MPKRRAEWRGKKTVNKPDVTEQPQTPATSAQRSGSLASFKCKWCGTVMQNIRATSVNNTARPVRGFGLCPKCEALVWSKPLEEETPENGELCLGVAERKA